MAAGRRTAPDAVDDGVAVEDVAAAACDVVIDGVVDAAEDVADADVNSVFEAAPGAAEEVNCILVVILKCLFRFFFDYDQKLQSLNHQSF